MSPRFASPLLAATLLVGVVVLSGCGSSVGTRPTTAAETTIDDPAEPVPARAMDAYSRALEAMRVADWTEAELELEQLTLAYPAYAGPHVNLGILYMATGRESDAEVALNHALSLNPQHAQAYNQLGILARRQGRFVAAEQAYQDAIAADGSYALAHYNLGVLLDLYLNRPADALIHYERYQALLPEADQTVAKWIVELRRRAGLNEPAARVSAEETL